MGWEGINHASFRDLFTMILFIWLSQRSGLVFSSLGRCLLEKEGEQAGAPDLVVYVGENAPRWQAGEKRRVDLKQWRVPDLVGEISDTTLAIDLDEKKKLYAQLGIPEYWVIDVQGKRVFVFRLTDSGNYQPVETSEVLVGLPMTLVEEALNRLPDEPNGAVALWFASQVQNFPHELA